MRNVKYTLNFTLLILMFMFTNPMIARAVDYFVDINHVDASDSNPGTSSQPWKTITKANQTLNAGDIVYIRAGTYNSYISPVNSGTSGNRITYIGVDDPVISGQTYGVYLDGDDYITIQDITISFGQYGIKLIDSDYNILDNITVGPQGTYGWDNNLIKSGSNYNWVKNSTFYEYGDCTGTPPAGSDRGYTFAVGTDDPGDTSHYNLIEDNVFYRGGHHVVGLHTRYNVFRGNYIHNEAWSNGRGNRSLYMAGFIANTGYNLIEDNRVGYSAPPCDETYIAQVSFSTQYNIFRYNSIYHGNAAGIAFYGYSGYSNGSYNKVYNNTFFNNGDELYGGGDSDKDAAVAFLHADALGNVLKNNLNYSHTKLYGYEFTGPGDQTYANNFGDDSDSVDPLFINASTTPPIDKTGSTLPNLTLQSASPAINAGGALTTVSSGCSGVTSQIVMADASYFQDGTWGVSSEVDADWIAVGTVSNVVQISSISNNTVDLAAPISCSNGNEVWIFKDSDGTQVLYEFAPDAGAYEFTESKVPSPPTNVKITEP